MRAIFSLIEFMIEKMSFKNEGQQGVNKSQNSNLTIYDKFDHILESVTAYLLGFKFQVPKIQLQ